MYCRCNPDEELRRLEREAAGGDPSAQRRLYTARARAGDQDAQIRCTLWELASHLEKWVNQDGRTPLRGQHDIEIEGEHPHSDLFTYQSEVFLDPQDSKYKLLWASHFEIDETHLEAWQKTLHDVRLLRPFNELKIQVELTTITPALQVTACPTLLQGVYADYIQCDFYPMLIRAGDSWHSGWHAYPMVRWQQQSRSARDPVIRGVSQHPIFEVIDIIRAALEPPNEPLVINAELFRQAGSPS